MRLLFLSFLLSFLHFSFLFPFRSFLPYLFVYLKDAAWHNNCRYFRGNTYPLFLSFLLFHSTFFRLSFHRSLFLSLPSLFLSRKSPSTITADISLMINLLSASPPDCGWALCTHGYQKEAPRRPASLLHTSNETFWSIWTRTEPRSWPSGSSASKNTTCQKPGEAERCSSAWTWNPQRGRLYSSTLPCRIYLIGSTPGRFQGSNMEKWGHLKLRKVCETWDNPMRRRILTYFTVLKKKFSPDLA